MPASHAIETVIENSPASSTITFPGNLGAAGTLAITGAASTGALTSASAAITGAATVGTTLGVTGATTLSSTLGVTGAATIANLIYTAVARTATSDGLTTGTIADSGMLQFVTVTASSANDIIVLPTPTPGSIVILGVAATGYELRTSSPNTVGINGTTGQGSAAESAIGANTLVVAVCQAANSWKAWQLGADGTLAKVEVAAN